MKTLLPFTEQSVNQRADAILSWQPGTEDDRKKLKEDWRGLLRTQFRLTHKQAQKIQTIPLEEVEKIQRALSAAADKKGELRLTMGRQASSPTEDTPGTLVISTSTSTSSQLSSEPQPAPHLEITILRCTFYADCSGWSCRLNIP